jgi:hypothetical protein
VLGRAWPGKQPSSRRRRTTDAARRADNRRRRHGDPPRPPDAVSMTPAALGPRRAQGELAGAFARGCDSVALYLDLPTARVLGRALDASAPRAPARRRPPRRAARCRGAARGENRSSGCPRARSARSTGRRDLQCLPPRSARARLDRRSESRSRLSVHLQPIRPAPGPREGAGRSETGRDFRGCVPRFRQQYRQQARSPLSSRRSETR